MGHFPCDEFVPIMSAFSAFLTTVCLGSVERIVYREPWKDMQVVATGKANNEFLCITL